MKVLIVCLLWGRQAIQIYNDAYAAGIGARHPLGDSAFENFADMLPAFEPLFEVPFSAPPAHWPSWPPA